MNKLASLALAVFCLSVPLMALADEDVQAKPKELTAPGTKGARLKVDPKNNPAAATKATPLATKVEGTKAQNTALKAAEFKDKAGQGK
jgi:hypothetical protein